jgi:hypothetical protein
MPTAAESVQMVRARRTTLRVAAGAGPTIADVEIRRSEPASARPWADDAAIDPYDFAMRRRSSGAVLAVALGALLATGCAGWSALPADPGHRPPHRSITIPTEPGDYLRHDEIDPLLR